MHTRLDRGFTLIELLIVIAIIAILAAVMIPNLVVARAAAQDRAGDAYVKNVYVTAQAVFAEDIHATTVAEDCTAGYTPVAGMDYHVPEWPFIETCSVAADGSSVTATWTGGRTNSATFPPP